MTKRCLGRAAAIWLEFLVEAMLYLALTLVLAGCGEGKPDAKAEAPPPATVEPEMDANNFKI
jgi:hypothetical protein